MGCCLSTMAAPVYVNATAGDFRVAGSEILSRRSKKMEGRTFNRRWMSLFGVTVETCVRVWDLLSISVDDTDFHGVKAYHLLWSLMFLKVYGSEEEMAVLSGADEKTFQKWAELFVRRMSNLLSDVIDFDDRKVGDTGNDCLVSVDCTDCMVSKIGNGNFRSFKSHKFKYAGLRYEIALCILTGHIVWVMGPFPCGDWPDINIFRYALKWMLDVGERVEADDGYVGEDPRTAKVPGSMVHNQDQIFLKMRTFVRHRHETVNKRMKQFKLLSTLYRGNLDFHGSCFRAVALLTQLEINNGAKLFDVTYSDDYFTAFEAYG